MLDGLCLPGIQYWHCGPSITSSSMACGFGSGVSHLISAFFPLHSYLMPLPHWVCLAFYIFPHFFLPNISRTLSLLFLFPVPPSSFRVSCSPVWSVLRRFSKAVETFDILYASLFMVFYLHVFLPLWVGLFFGWNFVFFHAICHRNSFLCRHHIKVFYVVGYFQFVVRQY